jgi:hypothetical protein
MVPNQTYLQKTVTNDFRANIFPIESALRSTGRQKEAHITT